MTDSDDSSKRADASGASSDPGAGGSGAGGAGADPGSDTQREDEARIRPETDPAAELEERPTGEERVGEVLSRRYRLTEFLGRGAMGEVFRAEHALMKKTVAIKILHSDVSGHSKIVERFRREAQAAANIDHPNVCVATDFGRTADKEFFLVMEFLEGPTLKEAVREQGAFEVDRALYIANQICSALVRAHEVGVVHRDLKPDNIMLVQRGEDSDFVKILDFGIARVRMDDETPELTKTGAVFGTPSYMSPEQAAGDPVDRRTDLYAIGSLLFEMLTGRRVFEADRGAEVMAKHVSEEPPKPSAHSPYNDISGELEELILELLEKNPDDRPQTAVDLHRRLLALGGAEAGPPIPGVPGELSVEPDDEAEDPVEEPTDASRVVPRTLDAVSDWFKRHDAGTRWAAVGLSLLVVAMATTFVGFVATDTFGGAGRPSAETAADLSLAEQREVLEQRAPVRRALREYDRGAIEAGIDQLKRLDAEPYRDNPHLEYLIGRGFAELGQWENCLDHFEAVLELEPRYIENRRFLRYLLEAFESEQESVVERVRELLRSRLDRPLVRSALGRTAWRSSVPRTRRRAHALLEETEVLGELPEWMQRAIALRRAQGCGEHRKRIEELVEHGDPRGLPILRIYRTYPDSVVGCVRDDITEGIRTLEGSEEGDG